MLDCLDCATSPFSKGTLVAFRQRLSGQQMERRLRERTVEMATSGACGARQLRAALESSLRWGAGARKIPLICWATPCARRGCDRAAAGAGAARRGRGGRRLPGERAPSLTAALALDWDDATAQQHALTMMLGAPRPRNTGSIPSLSRRRRPPVLWLVWRWHSRCAPQTSPRRPRAPTLRQGVAAERRMSVADAEMRHGRKSRSLLVDGDKRHVLRDLDARLIAAVGVTPANVPEASVTDAIATALAAQQCTAGMAHRPGVLARTLVQQRTDARAIFGKAWPVRSGLYFPKRPSSLGTARTALSGRRDDAV